MSLTVEKLNDDTTFLLAFAPQFAPVKQSRKFPGAFTILIDPWLNGHSSILHPSFQISHHTSECAIKSLADLEEQPDVIIISQDKPDHCHRKTLCQLPKDTQTQILATPAAAKKIRSWQHFDSSIVHAMQPHNATKPAETLIRIKIPAYTSSSSSGEITIANIPTKMDVTKLHNAIGITYRPPGSLLTALDGKDINLFDMMRPPASPKLRKARSSKKLDDADVLTPPLTPRPRTADATQPVFDVVNRTVSLPQHSTPPDSPPRLQRSDSMWSLRHHREKPISVLYTPHGVDYTILESYMDRHLKRIDALPLTALFHCVNVEANPWFMGGIVANGAPGAVPIVHGLGAKHWISAHDEVKYNRGVATTWIKSRQYTPHDVRMMLQDQVEESGYETKLHLLKVGEVMRLDG